MSFLSIFFSFFSNLYVCIDRVNHTALPSISTMITVLGTWKFQRRRIWLMSINQHQWEPHNAKALPSPHYEIFIKKPPSLLVTMLIRSKIVAFLLYEIRLNRELLQTMTNRLLGSQLVFFTFLFFFIFVKKQGFLSADFYILWFSFSKF